MVARLVRERATSGRAEREAARAKVKSDIQTKTEETIVKLMPYLVSENEGISKHDKAVSRAVKKIRQRFQIARDHQIAREYLEKRIERFNDQNDTDLAIPIAPVRFRFGRLRRTANWCRQRRALNEAHEQLMIALNSNKTLRLSIEDRLGLILYFAATYGGLCGHRALVSLRQALVNGATIHADHATQLIWIDLDYPSKGACNEVIDGRLHVRRRWFIPPACRLVVLGYLRNRTSDDSGSSNAGEYVLIKRAFETVSKRKLPVMTLKRFCSVGIAIAERQPGADLSELEVSYATDVIECMSLRRANWELCLAEVQWRRNRCD